MIIEFVDVTDMSDPGDAAKIILIHISDSVDRGHLVTEVAKKLRKMFPNFAILVVPEGKPCPGNPLPKVTIFDKSNESLLSAIKKMCEHGKPGAYIPLEKCEMNAVIDAIAMNRMIVL